MPFCSLAKCLSLLVIAIVFLFNLTSVSAQSVDLEFRKPLLTSELPNNSVLAIAQDTAGFMWFGTFGGLCRYDSKNLKTYLHDPKLPNSISSDIINRLYRDKDGSLWVGTNNGLNLFDAKNGSFKRFMYEKSLTPDNKNNRVASIFKDSDNTMWVGTYDGLNKITDLSKGSYERFLWSGSGMSDVYIAGICEIQNSQLLVATDRGLYKITKTGKIVRHLSKAQFKNLGLESDNINVMILDKKQNAWLGMRNGSIIKFDYKKEVFQTILSATETHDRLLNNLIFSLEESHDGKIWVCSFNGIRVIDPKTNKIDHHLNDPENDRSLSDNAVFTSYQDKTGVVWIGTYSMGVDYTMPGKVKFHTIEAGKGNTKLKTGYVTSINEDFHGNLWIGTGGAGISFLDKRSGIITSDKRLLPDRVTSSYIDKQGNLWVSSFTDGLAKRNMDDGAWTYYKPGIPNSGEITNGNRVAAFLEDSQGRFWVAARRGLYSFSKDRGTFKNVLKTKTIPLIWEDSKKNIWLAIGWDPYMYRIEYKSNKLSRIPIEKNRNSRIVYGTGVYSMHEDKAGNIWLVGHNYGLKKLNSVKNIFETFESKYFKSNDFLSSYITSDSLGRLWFNMDTNLGVLDIKTGHFAAFGKYEGINGNEFNAGAILKNRDGNLYFGTNRGIVYFKPESVALNDIPPKLVFTNLEVNGHLVAANDSSGILKNDISVTSKISLNHEQNFFRVGFACLNYVNSEKNSFAYKLQDVDKDWNYTNDTWVTYNNLAAGSYTLLVKGANNHSIWNEEPIRLRITVLSPWWQTWRAYSVLFACIALLFYMLLRYFWMQSKLKQSMDLNKSKMDFFTNISHEIRTHLTLILGPVDRSLTLPVENREVKEHLETVKHNSNRLLELVTELLDFRKIDDKQLRLSVRRIDLVEAVYNVAKGFDFIGEEKHIHFTFEKSKSKLEILGDRHQLEKVFFNLLSNAYKFIEQNGNISIHISETETDSIVKITDDGKGIAPEHLGHIFDNYFQVYEYDGQNSGYGIGLALSRKIVELHHGTIHAESIQNENGAKSTSFTVSIPKGNADVDMELLEEDALSNHKNGGSDFIVNNISVVEVATHSERETIMIAEDNSSLLYFLTQSLKDNFIIVGCSDGQEAHDYAVENIPDLIITDIMMPGIDGIALCSLLKKDERTSHIPIIMLTAQSSEAVLVSALEAKADHYLTKPFKIAELALRIHNLLSLKNSIRSRIKEPSRGIHFSALPVQSGDDTFLKKLAQIVEENIADSTFTSEDIAKEIGMSRAILYKKLKAVTDLSVNDFAKNIRISYAAKLLLTGNYHVNEVTEMVGFSDRRHFSKEFKKIYQMNPSEYIAEHKGKGNTKAGNEPVV